MTGDDFVSEHVAASNFDMLIFRRRKSCWPNGCNQGCCSCLGFIPVHGV